MHGKYATPIDSRLPSLAVSTELNQLEIDTVHDKLLHLDQYNVDLKLERDVVNIYIKLKNFQMVYNHQDVYKWISKNFFLKQQGARKVLKLPQISKKQEEQVVRRGLEEFFSIVVIKGCAELFNVSTILNLNDSVGSVHITHTKLLLDQLEESRNSSYQHKAAHMLFSNRHWSLELMVESLWWCLDNKSIPASNHLKKTHIRGSAFYIGVGLIKLSSYSSDSIKFELSIHTLRTEWSKLLSVFMLQLLKCFKEYSALRNYIEEPKIAISKTDSVPFNKILFENGIWINLKVTDVTCFFINQHEHCVLFNLAEITLTRSRDLSIIKFDALQLSAVDFSKVSCR